MIRKCNVKVLHPSLWCSVLLRGLPSCSTVIFAFFLMLRYDPRWSGCDPLLRPCSVYDPFLRRSGSAGHCFTRSPLSVPIKTRNDLKRPITNKKRPTVSKTPLTMTWPYLQGVKKRRETTNNKQILRLFYNIGQYVLFSNLFSTQHLVAIIRALLHGESWWKQSVKHLLSWVKHQLSCVFFTGYKIYLISVWVSCQQEKREAILLALLFHFHPLRKSFGLQRLHLSVRFNDKRGLRKRIQEPY